VLAGAHGAHRREVTDEVRRAGDQLNALGRQALSEGQIEVSWDPAADQRPARETITEHLEAGRYAEAIPLLETTLQLQPDDVQSLTQLGMVKSDLGELEEARRLPGRAVELDSTNGQALVSLGVAALRAGDPDGAEPPLQQAVALEPTNPYAHRALGQIHLMRDDPAAALPHRAWLPINPRPIRSRSTPWPNA
jgi:Flp pilus assembly protein TadD